MPIPRWFSRVLLGGALIGGGGLAVIGALAVRGPGLIGIGLAAVLAGCTAAGIAREVAAPARGSAFEAAVRAAGGAAGILLVVAGISTVAGGAVAGVVVAVAVVAVAVRLVRGPRPGPAQSPAGAEVLRLPPVPSAGRVTDVAALPPVASLTTSSLCDEWLRTTAALGARLAPSARSALVLRRGEALDELERRDPAGFASWMAAGPDRDSDPADFFRAGPARPGPVADTDAA